MAVGDVAPPLRDRVLGRVVAVDVFKPNVLEPVVLHARELRPIVRLVDQETGNELFMPDTEVPASYFLPPRAIIKVDEGSLVEVGDVIARLPQESSKTRDITGGLPRVADLFEARIPKEPAILAGKEPATFEPKLP
ncbi:hypothetical protein PN36_03845 [Candidatus Thiomargarita nelsonii]|uniref:DNA-directed RNA polymerase n=1 Tax=Candidatus Thiomargarita nelsonii TaxID=1003181 RepID=A0A4E0QSV8_9GAMM|nr:hypothetical protein PN36_03845 [Candidatus Thiomargarita nelsonii]